jgi:Nucleotidyltransferase/DNA polymerase involved in DNA repair
MADEFVAQLPIKKFHGIGKVTAERMSNMGIHTGYDLRQLPLEKLLKEFGKAGKYYYNIARGEDYREVNATRIRKSVGSENTFVNDLIQFHELQHGIQPQMEEVWQWCSNQMIFGRTLTVKIKFDDFTINSRSRSTLHPITEKKIYDQIVTELLSECYQPSRKVRLLGVSVSNLVDYKNQTGRQLEIDFTNSSDLKEK